MATRGPEPRAAVIEVEIERCAAGGNGVGRLDDGMVVFVPRTAPGDRVVIDVHERRDRWARGGVVSILRRSGSRVEPECPHYVRDRCGGCQLQHVDIETQRSIKSEMVGDALRRIGGRECDNPEVVASPDPWRYRRKITLARGKGGDIGLHPYDDPSAVFDLDDCLITEQAVVELWTRLRVSRHLLPPDMRSLTLCRGRDNRLHVVIRTQTEWNSASFVDVVSGGGASVWVAVGWGTARQVHGPATNVSPDSFDQVNPEFADLIREYAVDRIGDEQGTAWDLYGGFGDTAVALESRGYQVWSVDVDPAVRAWAQRNRDQSGIKWVTGQVERVMAKLPTPRVGVANPPRTGLAAAVAARLNELFHRGAITRFAYISCDPATLARDLSRLPAADILDVRAFDLFPQTSHVETVVILGARRE